MPAPEVVLRAAVDADADALFAIAADLDTWEERSSAAPGVLTRAAWEERQPAQNSGGNVRFVIDVDGRAVGSVGLFEFDELARNAEIGIALAQDARRRGIGTAAIAQMVAFGFTRRNLHRIHLQAIESNVAALRSYAKAGFVEEGRQREHAWVRGRYEDIVLMGIVRPE